VSDSARMLADLVRLRRRMRHLRDVVVLPL